MGRDAGDRGREPGRDLERAIALAASGDGAAFGAFYDATARDVLAFFYRRVMCPHLAADLAAETFAKALANAKTFDPSRGTARAWLFGIASHLHVGWQRRGVVDDRARRRLGIARVEVDDLTIEEIEASVDLRPLREAMRDALDLLSPPLRDAVLLRVGLDLPYAEVAARLGVTVATARVRVSRALSALHDVLEPAEAAP
ncbi:MAG TPA: RNA polymerase sigma factor [Acidimicrobiales bacterium]